ncbi:MAG: DUF362 domain-containing protein [Desulforhopalus sp.]
MNDISSVVLLKRCTSYDRVAIASIVDTMLPVLNNDANLHGRVVLLNPNLISATGSHLSCTHGEFICAVAECFLDRGARVRLGDSPAFGRAATVCRKLGIDHTLAAMNVELVEFATPLKKTLASGITVTVAKEALECDLFVGLPKVKAHNQTYMTLALKNIFGIVKGTKKATLHMTQGSSHRRFAGIIIDLLSLLPAQLHLADGIKAMHKTGPLHGERFDLNCIAGSVNPVALDTALLGLLELDCHKSPLWQVVAKRKMTGWNVTDLIYPYLSPRDFEGLGFIAPEDLNPIRFNPMRFFRGMVKRVLTKV